MKSCTLITGTPETKHALESQLKEILGEFISINSYAVDEGISTVIRDELIVYSSTMTKEESSHHVDSTCPTITAKRSINYHRLDRLFQLKEGTPVLCVNDTPEMAKETIDTLKRCGMTHLHYHSYDPATSFPPIIKTAITPGEVKFVPPTIETTIDIGVRLIDITTLMEILEHFQLKQALGEVISQRYIGKIIELNKDIKEMNKKTEQLNKHLQQVVDGVNDGVMAIDNSQQITVFNPFMEAYTGYSSTHALGKTLPQIFKHSELLNYMTEPQQEGSYFTLNGYSLMVYKVEAEEQPNTIYIFKNTDETISMEKAARKRLTKTGYVAKYDLQDLIGSSPAIAEVKDIARKLAKTDLPVLIQGETGTGKELFAHAVHLNSKRVYEPFLAVNFSALPEELLESELFGYEEGAFTGAKRGGKKGLFEQADGGTIFLDEIGDSSLKLQARLLRVIQEMEIRRIGGSRTIPINVRIIAATNKDLLKLTKQNEFREDLYHRLKVLFLSIPPLRDRKEDIPALVHQFLSEYTSEKRVSPELMEMLQEHTWPGNIRELKNTIAHMIAVADSNILTVHDLPHGSFSKQEEPQDNRTGIKDQLLKVHVLEAIKSYNDLYESASRSKIKEHLHQHDVRLTDQQIRRVLELLEQESMVTVKRGRYGTQITEKGLHFLSISMF